MRIKEDVVDIDYSETERFFNTRAKKYREECPYTTIMYQDNNPDLVKERNKIETDKLYPLLGIGKESKILDMACGIGRWADVFPNDITEYCGVDFSEELIKIAKQRNQRNNYRFYKCVVNEIEQTLREYNKGKYNVILIMGILLYLNDNTLPEAFEQIERCCLEQAVICIREPIALESRLTLKEYFSEELNDNYNAVYRTRKELFEFFEKTFLKHGFYIKTEDFLFDEKLNNRKETAQYYFILERK